MIKEKIINSIDELLSLKLKWESIVKQNQNLTPFQSPSWLISWWYNFGEGLLFVYIVMDDDKLLFLAPCFIRQLNAEKEKKLVFIGTGNTDYQDCIYNDESQNYFNNFINVLNNNKDKWNVIDLSDIHPSSPLINICQPEENAIIPTLNLNRSYHDYINRIFSKKKSDALKRQENVLKREGLLEFQVCDSGNLNVFFEDLLILNWKRWHNSEQGGILNSVSVRSFLSETSGLLYKEGYLKIFRLTSNKKAIAASFTLIKNKTLYVYIPAFDPDFQKYSPGLLLNLKIIEWCTENGIKEFNLLKGAEDYKFLLGAESTSNYRITL